MSIYKKHNTSKLKNKKENYVAKKLEAVKKTKEAINILSNLRTNVYQRIYYLITSPVETWRQVDFLSSEGKIESFISRLEKEIKTAKGKSFNFEKYRTAILCILGKSADKFNEAIIKNMYIAKLQNIIFLIKENTEGNEIKEVKESNKNITR